MLPLFLAELKRSWIQLCRYPTEIIGGVVALTAVFYGLFLSARYIAGPGLQFGDRLDAIIVGYVLWSLVIFIMGDTAGGLQREAQTGTLEQVFLSPFGGPRVFLIRAAANLAIQLLINLGVLGLIMLLTGRYLSFPPALILPLIALLLGAYGLSMSMGALALLLKQVQQLLGIFNFALLFVLTVPVESWTGVAQLWGFLLPMASSAGILRSLMAQSQPLNLPLCAVALLNGISYFALGLWLFHFAERAAKRQGKLSGY